MSHPIIDVEGISKSYKISHQLKRNAHPTLKEDMVRLARKPLGMIGASGGVSKETLWALKDINFQVHQGDVVGLMGRNGSGKSTLFKILSRVTHPTEGRATITGSVASLLEVGTGFHPELTGRENVYFNGAVLGMPKKEIDARFDEIVAFSEVEKFLDTPVKFYSSGMKVRLAFSVAAHLDADIMIIDEVLAVGDIKFKKKSLNHMKAIAQNEGKTILFVSHIVSKIKKICTRGIVLDNGHVVLDGELDKAIEKYMELNEVDEDVGDDSDGLNTEDSYFSGLVGLDKLKINVSKESNGLPSISASMDLTNLAAQKHENMRLVMQIVDNFGKNVAVLRSNEIGKNISVNDKDKKRQVNFTINNVNLVPDDYKINLVLRDDDDKESVYFKALGAAGFKLPTYNAFGHEHTYTKDKKRKPPVILSFDID